MLDFLPVLSTMVKSRREKRNRKEGENRWSCIQERPSNGVLRVTEVTTRALFPFLFEFWGGYEQEKQRGKVNPGKRKRVCRNSGYWLYRPFEFIYFSFTRGATPAFSRSRTKPLFFLSLSPPFILLFHLLTLLFNDGQTLVARIHFTLLRATLPR